MREQRLACLLLGVGLAAGLYAQAPQFEVATMKALPAGSPGRSRAADSAQLHYPSASLLSLLREAYRLKRPEQVEGPAWLRAQMYEIAAKLPVNASKEQIPEMLQALLTERLKLSVHHETRQLPTNFLLVAAKGPKIRQVSEEDADLELNLDDMPLVHLRGRGSIGQLVDQFNHGLGGADPWIGMTGLSGFFEIKLDFTLGGPPNSQRDDLPPLPQALERLGLRVEVRKAPADIVVVDRVEKVPIDN